MHTDEELARNIQRGSTQAFTMLVDRHYNLLFGYLYRMCGGVRALAEDMTQETFLRLLRGISLYQPTRPFKPYLYAIATNLARSHYQRADTRLTHSITDESGDYYDERPSAEDTLIDDEAAQQVLWALSQLPDHQREVVVLFYYQEMGQKDIAEALHIPVGTVKSRLSLGLRRLRELVAEMETES